MCTMRTGLRSVILRHMGRPVCRRASSRPSNVARSCARRGRERNVLYCSQTLRDGKQLPLSPRLNKLPVKRIDGSRLMLGEHATCALIELRQIGKTPSRADPVLHHAPEAFHRIEVVSAMRRQEIQPKLLVPVGQRRCELMRPVDATAVGHHDHLFARVAKKGHHLMDVLAKPLRLRSCTWPLRIMFRDLPPTVRMV